MNQDEIFDVGSMPISILAGADLVRVPPDASLYQVADALTSREIGAVAVGTLGGPVMGIVSERDLTHAISARRDLLATKALDVAHTTLVWCDARATVAEVGAEMMEQWVRHVLVEDDGRLVGIVSARDLLGAYASAAADLG